MMERVETSNVSVVMVNLSKGFVSELPRLLVSSSHEEIATVNIAIPAIKSFFIIVILTSLTT